MVPLTQSIVRAHYLSAQQRFSVLKTGGYTVQEPELTLPPTRLTVIFKELKYYDVQN